MTWWKLDEALKLYISSVLTAMVCVIFHLVKIEGMFLRLLLQFVARRKLLLLLFDSARFLQYI